VKVFHVTAKIYRPGEIVGCIQRNYYSDPARQPLDVVSMQEMLDGGRPAGTVSRLCAHFAFARAELCSWYWSSQEARARACGDAASPYLSRPHYYEVEMDTPVEAPLAVAGWVFKLLNAGADATAPIKEYWAAGRGWKISEYMDAKMHVIRETAAAVDRTNVAHFTFGEDWKKAAAMWPLSG